MSLGYAEATANGLSDVPGFTAAGVSCDVRERGDTRLDLALIASDRPAVAAGVFTQHAFAAAPVHLCRAVLAGSQAVRGIVANSGNANACTGPEGDADAEAMQRLAADALGCVPAEVFVASTGRIGRRLPMTNVKKGIRAAGKALTAEDEDGLAAADAILTSDTRRKVVTHKIDTPKGPITLAGMAKGAGMIQPNMATMLAFLTTDAAIPPASLQRMLQVANAASFNRITVDGDMSTNDTVLLLANGASGIKAGSGPTAKAFQEALTHACQFLARAIVGDGERIEHVVDVHVSGAKTAAEADNVARAIANSLLVKTSWFGHDPNWGRLLDAAGYAEASMDLEKLTLSYQSADGTQTVPAFTQGRAVEKNLAKWKAIVRQRAFAIHLDLGLGKHAATVWTTDLTTGYVEFNKAE